MLLHVLLLVLLGATSVGEAEAADERLRVAIETDDTQAARAALDAGASPRMRKSGTSPLVHAARFGRLEIMRQLLDRGADPRGIVGSRGNDQSALDMAAREGQAAAGRLLLDAGVPVDFPGRLGATPLMAAAGAGHLDVAELLLARGASVKARDNLEQDALTLAARGGHLEIASLLLDHGADVRNAAHDGETALHAAAAGGYAEVARLLLAKGAPVDARDRDGRTALVSAAAQGLEVVRLLLQAGADRKLKTKDGATALDRARASDRLAVVELLRFEERAQAALRHRSACETGDAAACNSLGYLYETGSGVERDAAQASRLYARACEASFARGCVNAGVLLSSGSGVPKDVAAAALAFGKACDAGSALGCFKLGLLREDGDGVERSTTEAAALHGRACEAGNTWGCHRLARLLRAGDGVPEDAARAAGIFEKACAGGYAPSCLEVSLAHPRTEKCEFDVKRPAISGGAELTLAGGKIVALELYSFCPGLPGRPGYSCGLEVSRQDAAKDVEEARWEDRAAGAVTLRFPELEDALGIDATEEGFVLDLRELMSAHRCGAGAAWPERIVLTPGKRACQATAE